MNSGKRPDDIGVENLEDIIGRKKEARKNPVLRYLFWENTLRCNLSCRHCGSDCMRENSSISAELPPEAIERELSDIASKHDARSITFVMIGGEPLIRKDVERVGRFAAGLGFSWGITTNGQLLDAKRAASLLDAGLATVAVSLDGPPDAHDALRRRKGSFGRAAAAVSHLMAAETPPILDAICCVTRLNIDRLDEFVDVLLGIGVPGVRLTPVFPRGRAGRDDGLALSPEQTRRLLEFIAAKRAEGFVGGSELNVTCGEENYWGPEWEMRVRSHFHHCSSGTNIGSILHDGSVIGCPNVSHRYIEGNIRDARFADIWRGAFFRYRSGVLDQASERCRGCAHWDLCEGGGFHLFDPEDPNAVHCGMLRSGADPDGWRNGPQDCGHGGCAGCGG